MKKNIIIVESILFIVVVLVLGFGYITYQNLEQERLKEEEKNLVEKIKNCYSPFVKSTNDIDVFKKNENGFYKIGTITKDTVIELDSFVIDDSNDTYFPVKGTDYFVFYDNLEEAESSSKEEMSTSYLLKKKIHTNKTYLYQNERLVFALEEEYDFDVYRIDDKKHYVSFLGDIYYIQDNFEEVTYESNEKKLEKISIINFDGNTSISKLQEIFKHLKENTYQTISVSDYILWINGQIDLSEKSILLISYTDTFSSEWQSLMDEYGFLIYSPSSFDNITFTSGDQQMKVGDKTNYKYEVNSNTLLNRFQDMLKGVKEVKVVASQGVAVLNYHFFYDSNVGGCNESICLSTDNFRKQLDYLKTNGYMTLTMQEFNDWMDGKISVPEKSVLITIDDGAAGTFDLLPSILNEYQMHATLFLISGWWPVSRYQGSPYLEIQSHGHDLHHNNYCDSKGCGYKTLKLPKDEIIADLNLSTATIGTNLAFCYPFYQTNSNLVQAVKEAGFKLGFVGGNKKATRKNNKYYIPRYVIYKNTSLSSFIKMVS